MAFFVNLLLRAANLVEAEGRVARQAIGELMTGCAMLGAAAALGALTIAALAAALFAALAEVMSRAAALTIVGGLLAIATAIIAMMGLRLVQSPRWRGRR